MEKELKEIKLLLQANNTHLKLLLNETRELRRNLKEWLVSEE